MCYTKFHLPRPIFYSPNSKCICIGERTSVSFPHWKIMKTILWLIFIMGMPMPAKMVFMMRQCPASLNQWWPGARPTYNISIEFEIQPKFTVLWFKIHSADHNEILHTSRQYHQSGTKPNLVAKILATKFGGRLCRLPKSVAKISSKFQHLVNTGLHVDSLIKWLPFKVANTCKLDIIWVVYCSTIVNGSIGF